MIHVVALITLKPGMRAAFLEAFHVNAKVARAQPGCVDYAVAIDMEGGPPFQTPCGPDGLVIQEVWTDMASLGAHAAGAHMKEFGVKTKGIVANRAIYLLNRLPEGATA
ncbi:antibiotic biosynthesis monooxygenase [Variovorax paradoxus]|nr:antibiotic biosynthesis monooxygenase family protein [Variovorax paradoxus]MBT2301954.1 antibiotic biosynthesis monooxygenase [Variovorax paradoxus]